MQHSFVFGEAIVESGTVHRTEVPVARLPSGPWVSLPVTIVHGRKPGPVLWLSAGIHGDELNGVLIVDETLRSIDPTRLSGTVLGIPVVNVFGLISHSRYLPDRRDLNRCFPGSARGSLGGRLAHLFSEVIVARAHVGIDFHTGSNGRSNLPQIRCDLDDPMTRDLTHAFGASVALHANPVTGTLRALARSSGKRVLLFEGGEDTRLSRFAVEAGVAGSLRVMAKLGMHRRPKGIPPAKPVQEYRRSSWLRASRSGFLWLETKLGAVIQAGDVVATIVDPVIGKRVALRATKSGAVIGKMTRGLVNRGDAVIHVAEA